ncbi:MAG TPA: hypothetical protein VF228_04065 [Iamia sp.]
MKRLTKPTVALVAAVAMLVLLATPSAAQSGTVTGGTISVNLTPALTTTIGTPTCAASTLTVTPNDTDDGTISMDIPEGAFDYGTPNPHVLDANAAGTYAVTPSGGGTGTFSISGNLATNGTTNTARIHARTGTCTAAASECGPIITNISFTGTFTGSIGTTAPYTLSGTATISGSGTLTAFGCSAPFTAINGKVITITGMTVVF